MPHFKETSPGTGVLGALIRDDGFAKPIVTFDNPHCPKRQADFPPFNSLDEEAQAIVWGLATGFGARFALNPQAPAGQPGWCYEARPDLRFPARSFLRETYRQGLHDAVVRAIARMQRGR